MTDDTTCLIQDIRNHSSKITSFRATYENISTIMGFDWQAQGRLFFKYPSKHRSEGNFNGQKVITVSDADSVKRFFVDQKLVWQYNVKQLQLPEYLSYGFADLRDPFRATELSTMTYEGLQTVKGLSTYLFTGKTRNDFNIHQKAVTWPIDIKLYIDTTSSLLVKLSGAKGSTSLQLDMNYAVQGLNEPIDDSLFDIDTTGLDLKIVDVTDIVKSTLAAQKSEDASRN
jgi:outer membrane lipoprotein-sorting protein